MRELNGIGAVPHDVQLERTPHTLGRFALAPSGIWLIDTTWPMSTGPFKIHGHWAAWPRALTDKIRSSGLVTIRAPHDIAHMIAELQTDAARSPVAVDDASFLTGRSPLGKRFEKTAP